MLFASTFLAAEIERAETGLIADLAGSSGRRHPSGTVFVRELAGGVAACSVPGAPSNKVTGLGFDGVPEDAEWEAVESAFHERGVPVQVEIAALGDPEIGRRLTRRGYVLVGFENVLGRRLSAAEPAPAPAGLEVVESGPQDLARWIDVVVEGFASPDEQGVLSSESFPREELERVFEDMAAMEGFRRWVVRCQGEPAGGGGLRVSGPVAQLCGAATLPAHRRRGIQSALLAARLAAASAAGCRVAVVTTQPGSKSQENAQRQGFELLYTRAMLVREPAPA
jgi:GNAT superfamily N-acetyltransferase